MCLLDTNLLRNVQVRVSSPYTERVDKNCTQWSDVLIAPPPYALYRTHLKYVRLKERYEQHGEGDQLTDVLEPAVYNKILSVFSVSIGLATKSTRLLWLTVNGYSHRIKSQVREFMR